MPHSTRVWTETPATHVPPAPAHGRPPTSTRLVPGAPQAREVRQVAAAQPASAWRRLTLQQGSHGPLQADFCARRVVAVRKGLPGPEVWLLLRRHPRRHELKTYLCHAPADMPLASLARLAGRRWPIESCFQEGKQNVGLGDYEGRSWQGWHRHVTLCLLAHFFLVRQATRLKKLPGLTVRQVGDALRILGRHPGTGRRQVQALLAYRRERNGAATRSHSRRRARPP